MIPGFYVRYYSRRCPHCGYSYGTSFGKTRQILGPGVRVCSNCKTPFHDGSLEWSELSMLERLGFLFPPSVIVALGSLAVVVGVMLRVSTDWTEGETMLIGMSLLVGPFLLFYAAWRTIEIAHSKRRVQKRPSATTPS